MSEFDPHGVMPGFDYHLTHLNGVVFDRTTSLYIAHRASEWAEWMRTVQIRDAHSGEILCTYEGAKLAQRVREAA